MSKIDIKNLQILYYFQEDKGKPGKCYYYSNILDITPRKHEPRCKSKSELRDVISSMMKYTCGDLVSESYINAQMAHNRIIIILYDTTVLKPIESGRSRRGESASKQPEMMPLGFIMASIKDNEYYIDVICAKSGYGRFLLDFFMSDSVTIKGASSIGLSSLPHVLTYYPKFGFTHRKTCEEKGIELSDKIKKRIFTKSKLPLTVEETYDDDDFVEYLELLRDNGFGHTERDECKSKPLTKEMLKTGKCGNDGYYMKYCPTKH